MMLRKTPYGFEPDGTADREEHAAIRNGDIVSGKLKRPRNLNRHRMYWGMCTRVGGMWRTPDGAECTLGKDAMHRLTVLGTGRYDWVELEGLGRVPSRHSIDFQTMDETEASKFFKEAFEFWAARLGCSVQELLAATVDTK